MAEIWGRGREPQAGMDAGRLLELVAALERHGARVWLDGGWGVDALLGRQTRPHDDLDLVVRIEDVAALEAALAGHGYRRVHGASPQSFELVDAAGHQVDAHPVTTRPDGSGVYRLASGGDWLFPPGAFAGRGSVAGRAVPCLVPEVQLRNHATGYELDATHRADVAALVERFGLEPPT